MIIISKNDIIIDILERNKDKVMSEVLALDIKLGSMDDNLDIYKKEWNINGEDVLLGVKKA